ncbi:hypothetical protein LTR37_010259 [Vermiconidia calcicola]|uniref:Uncharacterized protein n=1 Tax=Vermiconidia calcicola TaxID=1690605 RepID=A0ACC3N5G1_9PEZI|nr:hypothetical protein LTR37_010259 [Vermiconidia calcicola]
MDHESLRTASSYLNNLLLARGLLRNSEPIDFVKPSKESRAQIINLVHDLILREDRDREQREHIAVTLRTLRADDNRKNHEIERLKIKNEESGRALVQAQALERAAHAEVKKVEKGMKSLQDQAAKLKTTLAQVKTQCTNDVRKRDLELARLKTHLQGQQRGNKAGMTAPSITITGGPRKAVVDPSMHDLGDPEYSLKQETTEFLTQLSQSLSDENDSLITLIRGTLGTMREMLGLPANHKHPDSAIGSMGSAEDGKQDANMLQALPTSYEKLAADMEATITHLKTILTNPNFVSMEEVELRDEEIARLREGWERMEHRWKEILLMMDGWRHKMDTGHTINIDDLRRGIGLVSPEHMKSGTRSDDEMLEQSFVDGEVSEIQLPGVDSEPESSLVLKPSRPTSASKSSPKRKRDVLEPPEFFDLRPTSSKGAPASPEPVELDAELGDQEDAEPSEEHIQLMTIAEKLDLARAEAEEAAAAKARSPQSPKTRSSSKLPRSATSASRSAAPLALNVAADSELDDTLGRMMPSPVKKTRIKGRPRRRKSTLSPEELEELMCCAEE